MAFDEEPPLALAMVALGKPELPATAHLAAWLSGRRPALPPLAEVRRENDALAAEWGPLTVGIGLVPQPIPSSELEGRCDPMFWTPEAARVLATHRAHLLVTVLGDDDPIARSLALTWLAAAAAATTDAVAVYWGAGSIVSPADAFVAATDTMTREQLPLDAWIRFEFLREQDGSLSLFTSGMRALGHMDFEVHHSNAAPELIRDRIWNAAHHVLDHGPVLKDGDTFGLSADERYRITRAAATPRGSQLRSDVVLRLAM